MTLSIHIEFLCDLCKLLCTTHLKQQLTLLTNCSDGVHSVCKFKLLFNNHNNTIFPLRDSLLPNHTIMCISALLKSMVNYLGVGCCTAEACDAVDPSDA